MKYVDSNTLQLRRNISKWLHGMFLYQDKTFDKEKTYPSDLWRLYKKLTGSEVLFEDFEDALEGIGWTKIEVDKEKGIPLIYKPEHVLGLTAEYIMQIADTTEELVPSHIARKMRKSLSLKDNVVLPVTSVQQISEDAEMQSTHTGTKEVDYIKTVIHVNTGDVLLMELFYETCCIPQYNNHVWSQEDIAPTYWKTITARAYEAYQRFCQRHGQMAQARTAFRKFLNEKGFICANGYASGKSGQSYILGIYIAGNGAFADVGGFTYEEELFNVSQYGHLFIRKQLEPTENETTVQYVYLDKGRRILDWNLIQEFFKEQNAILDVKDMHHFVKKRDFL